MYKMICLTWISQRLMLTQVVTDGRWIVVDYTKIIYRSRDIVWLSIDMVKHILI